MSKVYEWVSYDVWGNAEDGFDVNDVIPTGSFYELDREKPSELRDDIQALFTKSTPRLCIDNSNEGVVYVEIEETAEPLGEFRLTDWESLDALEAACMSDL